MNIKNIIVERKGGGKQSLYTLINGHFSSYNSFKLYQGVYNDTIYIDVYVYREESDLKYESSYAVCSKDVTLEDVKFSIGYIMRMFKIDYLLNN